VHPPRTPAVRDDAARDYVEALAPQRRPLFDRVRRLIMEEHPGAAVVLSYQIPTYVVGRHRLYVGVWRHLHPSERGLAARRSPADADVSAPASRVPVAERPTVSLGVDPAYESAAASVDGPAPHSAAHRPGPPVLLTTMPPVRLPSRHHEPIRLPPPAPAGRSRTASGVYQCPSCGDRLAGQRRCEQRNCSPAGSAMADTAPAAATSSPSTNCWTSLSSPELSDPAPPLSTRRSPRPDSFAPDVGRERLHRQIRDGARVSGSKPEEPLRTRSQVLEAALGP